MLDNDLRTLLASGQKGLAEIIMASHAGNTTDEFAALVTEWIGKTRHPKFNRPYTELVYQPMLELITLLRANGFKTFIVSGGGIEFMRPWSQAVYGVPPKFIGRRPIAAFGNSDGDLQMLQWTTAGSGARFALLVHHTDAAREWAYDRTSHVGKLDKALDEAVAKGWTVVNMKDDWKTIFPQ